MTKSKIFNIKKLGFQWQGADPFLYCMHHRNTFPKGNNEMGPYAVFKEGDVFIMIGDEGAYDRIKKFVCE